MELGAGGGRRREEVRPDVRNRERQGRQGRGPFRRCVLSLMYLLLPPAVIDVTYLLEEGSGRRLRRRTLGMSDLGGRK